jgi:hypothetical protein
LNIPFFDIGNDDFICWTVLFCDLKQNFYLVVFRK